MDMLKAFFSKIPRSAVLVWGVPTVLMCVGIWLFMETVRIEGVVKNTEYKVISLSNSRIADIFVLQGDRVTADQQLLRLDSTALESEAADARAKLAMLDAAISGSGENSAIKAAEKDLQHAVDTVRQAENTAQKKVNDASMAHAAALLKVRELNLGGRQSPQAQQNLQTAQQGLVDAQKELELISRQRAEAAQRFQTYRSEMARLQRLVTQLNPATLDRQLQVQTQRLEHLTLAMNQAILTTPIDGVVNINTAVGDVVQQGQQLATVVPEHSFFLVLPSVGENMATQWESRMCYVRFHQNSALNFWGKTLFAVVPEANKKNARPQLFIPMDLKKEDKTNISGATADVYMFPF